MQNDNTSSTAQGNLGAVSTKSQEHQDDDVYSSLYPSFVFPPEATTLPLSTYTDPTINDSLYYSRLLMQQQQQQQQQQQHQDMINRHNLCLTRLREAAREVEGLRQENASLRSANRELNKHISFLVKSSVHDHFGSSDFNSNENSDAASSFSVVNSMNGLSIGGGGLEGGEDMSVESPKGVMKIVEVQRVSLPKSISVRSNGYLKVGQATAAAAAAAAAAASKARTRTPLKPTQKVYVRGGKQEEEPLELEVYNQGMFKTELCNKWQEIGKCPYGDHCQFAHGIEELRPVIRHPRYKTEVCRMVLAGDVCPYGHRCHFRHALSEEEKFMGRQLNPRSIKLN